MRLTQAVLALCLKIFSSLQMFGHSLSTFADHAESHGSDVLFEEFIYKTECTEKSRKAAGDHSIRIEYLDICSSLEETRSV